jgi:hypothetical protein
MASWRRAKHNGKVSTNKRSTLKTETGSRKSFHEIEIFL